MDAGVALYGCASQGHAVLCVGSGASRREVSGGSGGGGGGGAWRVSRPWACQGDGHCEADTQGGAAAAALHQEKISSTNFTAKINNIFVVLCLRTLL